MRSSRPRQCEWVVTSSTSAKAKSLRCGSPARATPAPGNTGRAAPGSPANGHFPMDPLVRRKLGRTNVELTQLGLGGAGLGDLFDVVEDNDASATLQAAWDAGIRYYDTSPWYGRGQSEHRFGRALYRRPRAEYVLSTKVGRLFRAFHDEARFEQGFWTG